MKKFMIAFTAALSFASVASAGQQSDKMLMTFEGAQRGQAKMFSLDYVSDGDTNALIVAYELPADAKLIDTKNCTVDLPKGLNAMCKVQGNKVGVVIYAAADQSIGKGLISIGRVSYRSASAETPKLLSSSASTVAGKSKPVADK